MKRMTAALLALFLLCLTPAYAAGAEAEAQSSAALTITAPSGILMEKTTGTILYEKDAHTQYEPASVTKVMTLLLVMEAIDAGQLAWEDMVTASAHAISMGGSQIWLKENEQLSVRDMVKAVAVVSANDCAVALAEHVAGSEEAFVALMNQRASELGMEHTHFENPNGLNDEGHYSTAADMAALARVVMEHEALAKIVGTRSITVAGRTLTNHNKLLWRYEGCTGLKTGYTDRAGRTLVSCAERDGQRLIAVTLNDPNDWADHAALFDYGFAHYRSAMLALANRTFRMLPVTGSLNRFVPVYTAADVYYPLTEGELVKARVELPERVEAPIQGGTIAGRLLFTLDGAVIGETYLLYAGDVADDRAGRGLFGRVLDWFRAGEADTLATVCCRWISDSNL